MLTATEDQEELRHTVRKFLEAKSPEWVVRRRMAGELSAHDEALWSQMADQLGLQGIALPEEYGGLGYGAVELSIITEEMGRALLTEPYFASAVLAASVVLCCGDEAAKAKLLPRIAAGRTIATFAGDLDPATTRPVDRLRLRKVASGYRLTGEALAVISADVADTLLVAAQDESGDVLITQLPASAAEVSIVPLTVVDLTRRQSRLVFADAEVDIIGAAGQHSERLREALDLAIVALASEQVGGAERCLNMAVDYAKQRVQFGRTIGSFQAIKHMCANMLMSVELSRAAAAWGAWTAANDRANLRQAASFVKAYCGDVYFEVASQNIQLHGGIGFTWDYPAQLYFKRSKSSQFLLGTPGEHRRALEGILGL
jgi:alkylation response protein AidB-like acyl-CoA dehydrogenase